MYNRWSTLKKLKLTENWTTKILSSLISNSSNQILKRKYEKNWKTLSLKYETFLLKLACVKFEHPKPSFYNVGWPLNPPKIRNYQLNS